MSMLSAQCDKLRAMAGSVGLAIPQAATLMMDAADTIERLCGMVRRELAEADRLRDERREYQATIDSLIDECTDHKSENAKLRELFDKVYGYYVSGTLTPCDFCDIYSCEGNAPTVCKADEYDPDGIVTEEIERLMRELGIEVK